MNRILYKDFFQWDIINWSKALEIWEQILSANSKQLTCLELGSRKGGLSLWLALKGHQVICSDLSNPAETARPLHEKYSCGKNITYEAIDATQIPYTNHFDIVIFKSILGGVSANGNDANKIKMINSIYNSLKPGGIFLFAENLEGTAFHSFMRRKFTNWGSYWNYLKYREIDGLLASFTKTEYNTAGFLGMFGRAEWQRTILGVFDTLIEKLIPRKSRYIVFGYAVK